MSPSCPSCSPFCRQRVQKTTEKHNPRANIVQDSPQDAQTPLPSLPKVPKTKENLRFFNVFRLPTHLLKSSQNAPRTAPEAPKLSSKGPPWPYLPHLDAIMAHLGAIMAILAPSWPILDGTCRQLDPTFAHLAPILPQLREKFSPKRAKDPKKRPKSAQDPPSLHFL